MPVWGKPLKTGVGAVRAMRNPRSMVRFGARRVLGLLGLSSLSPLLMPLISILLPTIQAIIKAYADAEIKRRLEEERKAVYSNVYQMDAQVYREMVPE